MIQMKARIKRVYEELGAIIAIFNNTAESTLTFEKK